jgi:hypothetical protein
MIAHIELGAFNIVGDDVRLYNCTYPDLLKQVPTAVALETEMYQGNSAARHCADIETLKVTPFSNVCGCCDITASSVM